MSESRPDRHRKSAQACQRCRSSKRKCDGRKPRCGTCARRGSWTTCVFDQSDGRTGKKAREIAALQTRVAELEREKANANFPLSMDPLMQLSSDAREIISPAFHFDSEFAPHGQPTSKDQPAVMTENRFLSRKSEKTSVDGMGTVGNDISSAAAGEQYFGESSTVEFVSQVEKIMNLHMSEELPIFDTNLPIQTTSYSSIEEEINDGYILPMRTEADGLISAFWDRVYPIYPLLERCSFEREYAKLWLSSGSPESSEYHIRTTQNHVPGSRIFHCILNMTFALGCQAKKQDDRSWVFWQRCKRLLELNFDIFNQGSIPMVQALLLMGIYLQGTKLTEACWNLVGVAIRLAQGLGLHRPIPSNQRRSVIMPNFQHREYSRRRVWMGCLFMDRTLCVTFGRPLIIPLDKSDCVNKLSTSSLPQGLSFDENQSSLFFAHAFQLQSILAKVIYVLYDEDSISSQKEKRSIKEASNEVLTLTEQIEEGDFRDLFQVEEDLEAWKDDLPDLLRLPMLHPGQIPSSGWNRHATILQARFLYGRILVFRPLLLRQLILCRSPSKIDEQGGIKGKVHSALISHASNACIQSACDLIAVFVAASGLDDALLPEPCYSIFYLYTASMILLVGHICDISSGSGENREYLSRKWEESLENLKLYQHLHETAQTCIKLLEIGEKKFLRRATAEGSLSSCGLVSQPQQIKQAQMEHRHSSAESLQTENINSTVVDSFSINDIDWNEVLDMARFGTAPFDFYFQEPRLSDLDPLSYRGY